MLFPVWRLTDQSTQLSTPEKDFTSLGGVVIHQIEAPDWEAANVEFCRWFGREPYEPRRE